MSKVKILTISVIALVILNLGMMVFFMVIKPKEYKSHRGGIRKMIVEKLDLDAQQTQQFEKIVERHKMKIDSIDQQIKLTKENLYAQLSEPQVNQKVKDSLINVLSNYQKTIENAHFKHFQNVKNICNTPEQQENYKELVKELGNIFSRRRMQHHEAGKGTK
jgi:Spy/CpxP family protein refolding chaperone